METLDQDPDARDDEDDDEDAVEKSTAGTQPARPTQMPVRHSRTGESAGSRLAREAMPPLTNLNALEDMLDPPRSTMSQGAPVILVRESFGSTMVSRQVTGRPKFSQLAQHKGTSSPTSGRDEAGPAGRNDMVDQQTSQDPIEDDSDEDAGPVTGAAGPKIVSFAKTATTSTTKTRGQKVRSGTFHLKYLTDRVPCHAIYSVKPKRPRNRNLSLRQDSLEKTLPHPVRRFIPNRSPSDSTAVRQRRSRLVRRGDSRRRTALKTLRRGEQRCELATSDKLKETDVNRTYARRPSDVNTAKFLSTVIRPLGPLA
jgi:hypothetical protein